MTLSKDLITFFVYETIETTQKFITILKFR